MTNSIPISDVCPPPPPPNTKKQEYLEKQWTEGLGEEEAIKLTVKTLLEVVDSGSKNMEVRGPAGFELILSWEGPPLRSISHIDPPPPNDPSNTTSNQRPN